MGLLSMHTTTCAAERNWSRWGRNFFKGRSMLAIGRAMKLVYIAGNLWAGPMGLDELVALAHDLEDA